MFEHQTAMEKLDGKSHIYKHYMETRGHTFNLDGLQISPTENLESSRSFIEGLHTTHTKINIKRAVSKPSYSVGILAIGQRR